MKRFVATTAAAVLVSLAGAGTALAQDTAAPGRGAVVVSIIPGGATFFTSGAQTKEVSFVNYGLGAGVEVHLNRYLGFEGEISGALGVSQDLDFAAGTANLESPSAVTYNGNLVASAANHSGVVPYLTAGVGGLTLLDQTTLGITDTSTYLTGNVGGGVKWFNRSGRWGLRGDYRFLAVRSNDTATAFFGQETRYGHSVSGGLLVRVGR